MNMHEFILISPLVLLLRITSDSAAISANYSSFILSIIIYKLFL